MYSKCTSLHHKINSLSKNPVLWTIKEPISSTLFDAQNAGNRISELLDFKFSWGAMPPDPPRGKGPCGPFQRHSRLIALQWPLIPNVIETPAYIHLLSSQRENKRINMKTKGIYICIYIFQVAMFLKTGVYIYTYIYQGLK